VQIASKPQHDKMNQSINQSINKAFIKKLIYHTTNLGLLHFPLSKTTKLRE